MPSRLYPGIDLEAALQALSGGDRDAIGVLMECSVELGGGVFEVFLSSINEKRLFDNRIVKLYELCGRDVQRFIYHIDIELPNQETGEWGMSGPYVVQCMRTPGFSHARRFGKPNSYWALEHPPTDPHYRYPLV